MIWRWFPWSWIVRRAARSFGIIDPALVMARVRRFGQPSQYDMPLEIVRNAIVFHARGLINTRVIQNNLDWIWPYWIQRQFDPRDVSFLPRSANVSHINLTHRNWTALGLPDLALYPLVDPRGLVTPLHDGWSIDAWVLPAHGAALFPSRLLDVRQSLDPSDHSIRTEATDSRCSIRSHAVVLWEREQPVLRLTYEARSAASADLVISLRPYNCEGVQFIDSIDVRSHGWVVNGAQEIHFHDVPDRLASSTYAEGDVVHRLADRTEPRTKCPVGMATAAACFAVTATNSRRISLSVPLGAEAQREHGPRWRTTNWPEARREFASLSVPDPRYRAIYEASINTLIHLTAKDVYPGPYTYRRFWFRDASLMLEALVQMGGADRARAHFERFPQRQRRDGYFESQEGEWDANGEVLWAIGRYVQLTGQRLPPSLHGAVVRAVDWLQRNRLPEDGSPQAGLLPAGFSAEHFGPNDHYYWDVYWAIAGLRSAASALAGAGDAENATGCHSLAGRFFHCIERSIERHALARGKGAVPASPFRRMDSGAIGVLVADYPLQIYAPGDPRLMRTVAHFLSHNFVNGGFFQDMTHSGVNIYLTLSIAQTLLRAGDSGWEAIIAQVQRDASVTGVWPEAIHPITSGGCIGDGQHGWAAAEWLKWTRNAFVREEGDELIVGSGLPDSWLQAHEPLQFGPTLTPWGAVSVELRPVRQRAWNVRIDAQWRGPAPRILVKLPRCSPLYLAGTEVTLMLTERAA